MKKIFLATFVFFLILSPFHSVAFAADPVATGTPAGGTDLYYGLDETADSAGLNKQYGGDVSTLAGNVIGSVLTLIGVIFFILMVYGGFLWMTAHGDSGQVDKAKETIIAAVIGMIVVASSYALTTFVFNATGSSQGTQPRGPSGGAPVFCANSSNLDNSCLQAQSQCEEGEESFPDKTACTTRVCELSAGTAAVCQ